MRRLTWRRTSLHACSCVALRASVPPRPRRSSGPRTRDPKESVYVRAQERPTELVPRRGLELVSRQAPHHTRARARARAPRSGSVGCLRPIRVPPLLQRASAKFSRTSFGGAPGVCDVLFRLRCVPPNKSRRKDRQTAPPSILRAYWLVTAAAPEPTDARGDDAVAVAPAPPGLRKL